MSKLRFLLYARHSKFILLFLFALTAISCKTAEFGFKVVDINGMIYDFSNRPVAFCEISLGRWYKGTSDINGRFTLSKVPLGKYKLSVYKNGHESYSDEASVKQKGQIIYIRLPSQNQLLGLADEALSANNFSIAEEMAERALRINENNIESLFYCAVVKFRQRQYAGAMDFLEKAKRLGSRDIYIEKFISQLKEYQYGNYQD